MASERFTVPGFELEEGERLTLYGSITGGTVTWSVQLQCGELSVHGFITQEAIDDAAIDLRRRFMEQLRQKIDDL